MNDQDYIRKAVELADGWNIGETDFGTTVIVPPFITPEVEGLQGWSIDNIHHGILDALAAQLVRQVDAIKYHEVMTTCNTVDVIKDDGIDYPQIISQIDGPDRTMNTIKAIVDSGVLR